MAVGVDGAATAVGKHVAEAQTLRVVNLRAAERAVAGGEPGPEGNITKLISAEHLQHAADLGLAARRRRTSPRSTAPAARSRRC